MQPPSLSDYLRTIGAKGGKVKSAKKRAAALLREARKRESKTLTGLQSPAARDTVGMSASKESGDGG